MIAGVNMKIVVKTTLYNDSGEILEDRGCKVLDDEHYITIKSIQDATVIRNNITSAVHSLMPKGEK